MNPSKPDRTKPNTNQYIMVENGYPHMPISNTFHEEESSTNHKVIISASSTNKQKPPSSQVKDMNLKGVTSASKSNKSFEMVSFIPQKGENNNCVHDAGLKKDTRTKCEKCALYSAIVGLIFVLSAIIW